MSFPIGILSLPLLIIAVIILSSNGSFSYTEFFLCLLIALALYAPAYVLHELFHFVFQWAFSRQLPRLSLRPPWPYSALPVDADISRKSGMVCAISPFLFITAILVLLTMIFNPQVKAILLLAAYIHTPTCAADFLLIYWLLRHPRHLRYGVDGLANALYEPIEGTS